MKTMITGSSGLVGSALIEYLFKNGHSIQCLRRSDNSEHANFWATRSFNAAHNSGFDTVIHLAGENVAQGRWTSAKKKSIMDSRVDGTRELVDYISQMTTKPKIFLSASAVGYYGNRGSESVDEKSGPGEGFLAEVCRKWEKETHNLTSMGVRVVNLRFGMVLSPRGGALHKMIPPFKAGLGGVIGNGNQFISWVSIRDLVQIVEFIIKNGNIRGPVNVVTPAQTTNRMLTRSLGKALHRPTLFRIPSLLVKIIFGQMADEMLLSSTRAMPKLLLDAGYAFKDQKLDKVIQFCTQPNKNIIAG